MRILNYLCKDDPEKLTYDEFAEFHLTLKYGEVRAVIKMIFDIFDFDKDQEVHIQDVIQMLANFPLLTDNSDTTKNSLKTLEDPKEKCQTFLNLP